MFQSTKVIELGSCAFRQPRASHSHCRFIHGYKLSAKFWFECKELDDNNWVVDFGGLKGLKTILQDQFDHTTCIAADDPALPVFKELVKHDACDLRIMIDGTGAERIAEWCFKAANKFIAGFTDNRCRCVQVEVFEQENNSAVYTAMRPHFSSVRVEDIKQTEFEFPQETDQESEKKPENVTRPPIPKKEPEPSKSVPFSTNTNKQTNTWLDPDAPKDSWRF